MKAQVQYLLKKGYRLIINAEGIHAQLFLEYLTAFKDEESPIQKITSRQLARREVFEIQMNLRRSELQEIADYINQNL